MPRDSHQQIQIFGTELVESVLRIDVDDPHRVARQAQHRDAHHRTDRQVRNRFARLKSGIAGRIRRQDPCLLFQNGLQNRTAQFDSFIVPGPAMFHCLGNHFPQRRIIEQNAAAVGVRENVEQRVEDLREQRVQVSRTGKRPADFQNPFQLGLGVDFQLAKCGRSPIGRSHDRRRIILPFTHINVEVCFNGLSGDGWHRGGLRCRWLGSSSRFRSFKT